MVSNKRLILRSKEREPKVSVKDTAECTHFAEDAAKRVSTSREALARIADSEE